jgi:hypothetical protein
VRTEEDFMTKSRILMLAAAFSASVAAPAFADWDNIGSVFINHKPDRDTKFLRLGGSVERLSVRPASSNVSCQSIRVTFSNGQTRNLFSGNLYEDRRKDLDLPGRAHNISRIDFNCVSRERQGTKLDIQADIGRYRDEWRRDRDWSSTWARMFAWANTGNNRDRGTDWRDRDRNNDRDWTLLGTERFSGRNDRETVNGANGINRIALKANEDARCDYVSVSFGNGATKNISGVKLTAHRTTELDLPGDRRDVRRVTLNCESTRDRAVSIGVYGIRS